jgi:hypothetical protein
LKMLCWLIEIIKDGHLKRLKLDRHGPTLRVCCHWINFLNFIKYHFEIRTNYLTDYSNLWFHYQSLIIFLRNYSNWHYYHHYYEFRTRIHFILFNCYWAQIGFKIFQTFTSCIFAVLNSIKQFILHLDYGSISTFWICFPVRFHFHFDSISLQE